MRWTRRVSMGTKLWLAGLLVMASVAVPTGSELRVSQQLIGATAAQQRGLALIQRAQQLMQRTRAYPFAEADADIGISQDLEALRAALAASPMFGPAMADASAKLQAEWRNTVAAKKAGEPPRRLREWVATLDTQYLQMIERVAERASLTLDSRPDTYYLMVATVFRLPQLTGQLQQMASSRAATGEEPPPAGSLEPVLAIRQLQQQQELALRPISRASASDAKLARRLEAPAAAAFTPLAQLLAEESSAITDGQPARAQSLASYPQVLDALYGLLRLSTAELARRLDEKAEALRERQYRQLALLLTLLAGLALMVSLIAREFGRARTALGERAQLLSHTEELAHIGCASTDLLTGQISWSGGMYGIFGEPESAELLHANWLYHRVPQNERDFVHTIASGVTAEAPSEFQHRILRADGKLRTVLHRGMVELDKQGAPRRAITILQDITQQLDAEQRIDLLANTCEITGLPNRNALLDHLDAKIHEAQREERNIALIVLEIDQLDIVANSLGLESGDRLLVSVAERLRVALEGRGMLAHLGNGEFAVVFTGTGGDVDEARAMAMATGLRGALSATVSVSDTEVQVSCAQGLTLCPRDGDHPQKLLQQAQAALSEALRDAGGERIRVFSSASHLRMASRLAMEAALRHALKRNEFHLAFQPQLCLHTGQIYGAEALLRWQEPKRGNVPPVEFIPLAEESGQIVEIGEWVLRQACLQNLAWQREGLKAIRVSVNLSVRQLQQADIAQRIQTILLETGMDPQYLALEITESILVDESEHVARVLKTLGALGIEIALDDFGTGYSNLSYLRKLPIKVLKIDRSIVHDVTAASHDVSMTRAVINMAHGLQLKVLAEGVESEGQLALLMANNCDQMQGHFFSAAVSPQELSYMLREGMRLPEHLFHRGRERERTLLLVDDEENIIAALKRLLRRDGYKIITATSGNQGLQRLVEQPIDVIVSDQRMPGMTGVEFLRRAKELYPETVRIVLSGYTELQSITDAINEGAIYKFLTKPWDDEHLRGHIAEAFRTKEMGDENAKLAGAVSKANQELAAVNQRLEQLALRQSKKISQEEISLQIVREVLDSIPASVIGIDVEGMIAYVNAEAMDLFAASGGLFAEEAEQALPPELLEILRSGDERPHRVELNGAAYQVICRVMSHSQTTQKPRGKLLVLTAAAPASESSHASSAESPAESKESHREPVQSVQVE